MVFWKKRMVELYSTINPEEKFRIQEALPSTASNIK